MCFNYHMSDRLIFHVDVNSAFISWEATRRVSMGLPDIRNIPSIIGGDPNNRSSIVAARSIPAKKYDIKSGDPVSMALQRCPDLVIAKSDFTLYRQCSKAFKAICSEYTPVMESFSIDEVFLDMTGMELLYPNPIELANTIKNRIRDELGFTVNVGIGNNKLCAKMASDFEKPDKVHTLYPNEIPTKMWPLPVGELFSCGKSTAAKLMAYGIKTIGNLANTNIIELTTLLGKNSALHYHNYANGYDDSEVKSQKDDEKSYSAETTFEDDITDIDIIKHILLGQADIVAARIRAEDAKCSCVAIKYKTPDFKNHSHQKKLLAPTDVTEEIYHIGCELIDESWKGEPIRLVGLCLSDIDRDGFEQMSLIVDDRKEKLKKLDMAMDSIRGKYGNNSIKRASVINENGFKKYL